MCERQGRSKSKFNVLEDSLVPEDDQSVLSRFLRSLPAQDSCGTTVIEDTLMNAELSLNSFVLGPPCIRFFAGAHQKVGMLCLTHNQPKVFLPKDIDMLSDLAAIISSIIEAKEQRLARAQEDVARLNIAVAYHLRHPLLVLTKQCNMLMSEYQAYTLHTQIHEQSGSTAGRPMGCYLGDLDYKLQSFQQSCHELEDMLELSLQLASQYIDSSSYDLLRKSSVKYSLARGGLHVRSGIVDLCGVVKQAKAKLQQAAVLPCTVQWLLAGCSQGKDNSALPTDGQICSHHYLTYPLVLQATILSTLNNLSQQWQHITVQCDYKDCRKDNDCGEHSAAEGYLEIIFSCTGSKDREAMPGGLFEEVVLKGVLSLVGGYLEKSVSTQKSTPTNSLRNSGEVYKCYIPVLELVSTPHSLRTPQGVSSKRSASKPTIVVVNQVESECDSCALSLCGTESIESTSILDQSPSIKPANSKHRVNSYRSVTQMVAEDEDMSIELSPRLKGMSSDLSMQGSMGGSGKFVSGVVQSAFTVVRSVFESKSAKKIVPT